MVDLAVVWRQHRDQGLNDGRRRVELAAALALCAGELAVFGVPEASLFNGARFGQELKAAPASDFKANEFDVIDGDIKDVADRRLLKEMAQGELVIQTVGDYCEHMVRCSIMKPEEVARILRLPATE